MAERETVSRFAISSGDTAAAASSSRRRVVWDRVEKRHLDRVSKIVHDHGDKIALSCGHLTCPDKIIRIIASPDTAGGAVLRCGCTDRVFNGC